MLEQNDDMDELLRRAAEDYPLKVDNNNFEKVLHNMQQLKSANTAEKIHPLNRLLWLAILLPLSFIGYKTMNHLPTQNGKVSGGSVLVDNSALVNKTTQNNSAGVALNQLKYDVDLTAKVPVQSLIKINTPNATTAKSLYRLNKKLSFGLTLKSNKNNLSNLLTATKKQQVPTNKIDAFDTAGNEHQPAEPTTLESSGHSDKLNQKTEEGPNSTTLAAKGQPANKVEKVTPAVPPTKEQKVTKASKENANLKRFYVGIFAGPDVSTVKTSATVKTGFTTGLKAGYQLNKKISIEAGLLRAKKFYQSDGKYFDKKNTAIPSYVKLIDLQGNCQMFELPVDLKYNVTGKKGVVYSTVGVSTYIMKEENYTYSYQNINNGWQGVRKLQYKNPPVDWFAAFNLSAGYQRNFKNNYAIRLEPYLKLPLNGAGTGNLPITSYGMYIGLTKHLF